MKTSEIKWLTMLLFTTMLFITACSDDTIRPPYLEEEIEPTPETKEFVVYDAMSYKNKPDLTSDMISNIRLIYEAFLLTNEEIDMDKVATQISITKTSNYQTVSTDIEAWYSNKTDEEIKTGLKTVFDAFKKEIPSCTVGNYGIPVSNLNVFRYNRTEPEEEIIKLWKKKSERRLSAGEVSDVLYPSLYIMTPDVDQWLKDLKTTVEYIKEKFPDKKIIGYIWPQYYNLKNNPDYMKFIPAEKWDKILEGCYTYLDGAVIWSNGKGEDGETDVAWNDTKVQAMYSATKTFIERHKANIKLDKPIGGGDDGGSEPTEFYVYGSLNFQNTPSNLLSYGIQPISVISEANVSETEKQGSVYPPVIDKIKNLATDATHPVCISISTWHADRSTDNSAMMSRFQTVYSTFKDNNSKVTIGYRGVGPTSLTSLRVTNYTQSDFQRNDSWQRYAVEPMRGIREYADVLYPEVTIINDDLDTWKQDCSAVLEEAKWNNPNKKIFACIMTNYFNKTGTIPEDYEAFADAYKPIKEATWLNALEYLYRRCDGIVIIGNCQKNDPIEYSEDLGLMKATKTFYENHKNIIDKTLPEEEKPTTDNLITNGGFEDSIEPSSTLPVVHTNSLVRPLRLSGFFDTTAQKTFPTVDGTVTVPDNVWFHRCNNNSWFWFTYIDDMSIAYTGGGTPISHSGNKSVVIYIAANADAAKYSSHANNLEHLQGVAQRLSLDDSKKYKLQFFYYRPNLVWGTTDVAANINHAEKIVVGIVSSTEANVNTDYTYEEVITLEKTEGWKEYNITFDLPDIIQKNPGKSFEKCAIFFNIVPEIDSAQKTLKTLVNLDDISLTETK